VDPEQLAGQGAGRDSVDLIDYRYDRPVPESELSKRILPREMKWRSDPLLRHEP
jgi:hypothetical protein